MLSDCMSMYLHDCGNHALLDRETERSLLTRAQNGDIHARDTLILQNQRLVIKIARKYLHMAGDQELSDLVQWGNFGLIKAIDKFNQALGYRFSTYAVPVIHSEIRRYALYHGSQVYTSFEASSARANYARAIDAFMQRNHREPNLEEVAAEMGVTEKLAEEIYHAYTSAVSLDHVASNHEYEFSQTIGELIPSAIDVPQEVETSETRSILQKAIGKLPKTQQTILIRRYGLDGSTPVTLDRLGLEMNLSGEAIRRHEKIAKATLKRTLNISMSS